MKWIRDSDSQIISRLADPREAALSSVCVCVCAGLRAGQTTRLDGGAVALKRSLDAAKPARWPDLQADRAGRADGQLLLPQPLAR